MNFLLKGCCLENLAACAARVGTMLCRYIVGKNMVILYSVTQPPATRDNNEQHFRRTASWTLQNLILMVGFSLIAYFFNAHAHLLFRLLSRNYLVRSLRSLMSLIVHHITLFMIYCIIQITILPEVFATPSSVKVWLDPSWCISLLLLSMCISNLNIKVDSFMPHGGMAL